MSEETTGAQGGAQSETVTTPVVNEFSAALASVEGKGKETAEQSPSEVKPEEPTKSEAKEDPKLGSRFAALTKRERAIQLKEAEVKAQLDSATRFEELKKTGKANPLAVLEELGMSGEELIQAILKQDQAEEEPDEVTKLRQTVDELLKDRDNEKKARDQQKVEEEKQALDSALGMYKTELTAFADANAAQFELVRALNGVPIAMDVMQRFFDENGEIPEPSKVLEYVEEYLTEIAKPVIGLKKFSGLADASPESRDKRQDVQDPQTPSPTISNRHTGSSVRSDDRPVTEQERLERASALLRFGK